MTTQEAIKILHPESSFEALLGCIREEGLKIVEEACLIACEALEKMAGIERALERLEELKCKPMELVYDVPLIASISEIIKEEVGA